MREGGSTGSNLSPRKTQDKNQNTPSTKATPRKRTPKTKRASSSKLRTPAINLSTGKPGKSKTRENTREVEGREFEDKEALLEADCFGGTHICIRMRSHMFIIIPTPIGHILVPLQVQDDVCARSSIQPSSVPPCLRSAPPVASVPNWSRPH